MHLGHARTALATWVRARQQNGAIVMRIEDLDPPRVVKGSAEAICETHRWLGLGWDEGPVFQSQRDDLYETFFAHLNQMGHLYPCTCTRKDVAEVASAPHGDLGPIYPGTCRLSVSHLDRKPAYRFKMPQPSPAFVDRVAGVVDVDKAPGDFVLRRADGLWSYQFAVVVDDVEMKITEVIRGDDLLVSTPRQIALYRALGQKAPAFAHLPLVVSAQGDRLATRSHATPVDTYRTSGWKASQIIGILAHSLGYIDSLEPITVEKVLQIADDREPSHEILSFPSPSGMPDQLK